jgi:hypothetical protein
LEINAIFAKKLPMDISKLLSNVKKLNTVLENTQNYRDLWESTHKKLIISVLENLIETGGIQGEVVINDNYEGLEAISLALATSDSGIYERISDKTKRALIRNGGVLTYHQLFNGKIGILIGYPYIEGIGQPKMPKTIEISRPEELKEIHILRHVEMFIDEIAEWEDFDDDKDATHTIGFHRTATISGTEES